MRGFLLLVLFAAPCAMTSVGSCQGRCGFGTDSSKACQCNPPCVQYGDCCSDYTRECVGTGSCQGRCGFGTDSSKACQCNPPCVQYGDCCSDYTRECVDGGDTESCQSVTDVSEYFWSNDANGLTSSQYTVNWQSSVPNGNTADQSSDKLFKWMDTAAYTSSPTIAAFVNLLDNYNSLIGTSDFLDSHEWQEIDAFYKLIRATSIFNKLYEFLLCKGRVSSDADFKSKFYNLWFDLYPRSSSSASTLDSSGFEHVMVGEIRVSGGSPSVSGFHNWVQFYEEEKVGRMNYLGYVRRVVPEVIGANFAWRADQSSVSAVKALGSFFLGTSPELELALYTLCAFEHTNQVCTVRLGGTAFRLQTWDIGHSAGLQIASAYPAI